MELLKGYRTHSPMVRRHEAFEAASLTAGATALHCAVDTMRCQHISRRGDPALEEALCRLLQKGGKSQKIRRKLSD